jgi:hypothetical protein
MSVTLEQTAEATMACPACEARQPWSDQCRRCKCDLSDLRAAWRAGRRARAACLFHLREGRFDGAIRAARSFASVNPGDDATRLLAVCHLLRGDWGAALRAALPQALNEF